MEMKRAFQSPAKVNLFLKVLGKRPDGYHELATLMQPVSLFDELEIAVSEGEGVSVVSDSAEAPGGQENLAFKAASVFLHGTAMRRRVEISVKKVIPVGAGLGGGSSDAATVLMALNEMTGIWLPDGALMEMAARIGSDVPFFILKSPALAFGRGEKLKRAILPELHYVLINPGFHVSTAWVYSSLGLTKVSENNNLLYSYEVPASREGVVEALENDLEAVTAKQYPELSGLKEMLKGAGALGTLMSGSGPTVFGVFHSRDEAERAYVSLVPEIKGAARIFLARGL
jgi:4-diphosphocytidyl-2-C-methyl-D-erythritol kinase